MARQASFRDPSRRTADADSHFVVPEVDAFAKIEGGRFRSLTISRSRLISFEVSSSGGNTKGRIAYLSGAQAEGRCWREADIREQFRLTSKPVRIVLAPVSLP